MKQKTILFLLFAAIFVNSCSSDKQSNKDLPNIDVKKDYPEKEFILTDIAEVTYVHLSAKNNDFLYKGTINYVSENTIVINDYSSGSILFFSKDGTPRSRFNRFGEGSQEYKQKYIPQLLYDEKTNEVFIYTMRSDVIMVYTSTGDYLREIKISKDVNSINFYDNQSLIINDQRTFYRISKADGEVLEQMEIPYGEADLKIKMSSSFSSVSIPLARIVKSSDGYYLCNPEADTIYLYSNNKSLTPVLYKTPLSINLDPVIILDNCLDVGKYQFMRVHTRHISSGTKDSEYPDRFYIRDKKNGDIFRQKIILPDYIGKELFVFPIPNQFFHEKSNRIHFELNLLELKEAYKENRLSGKLKELVATLDENNDNNVFMFVDFK